MRVVSSDPVCFLRDVQKIERFVVVHDGRVVVEVKLRGIGIQATPSAAGIT